MKHTPGPWFDGNDEEDCWLVQSEATDSDGYQRAIALVPKGDDKDESLANCQLMCAAPELLEALAIMLGAAETDCMDDKSNVWRSAMIDARQSIAKAEGRVLS